MQTLFVVENALSYEIFWQTMIKYSPDFTTSILLVNQNRETLKDPLFAKVIHQSVSVRDI